MQYLNKNLTVIVLAILGLGLVSIFTFGGFKNNFTGKSLAATVVAANLSSATNFSVLAALSTSSAASGTTTSGDLGLSPGLAVSRTGTWTVGGTEYFGPSSAAFNAQADALIAFNNLVSETPDGVWASASPTPGVWNIATDTTFAGPTLTLTGSPTDVWVFQIGNDMTFTGSVVLAGGAQACNVFWEVGRDATIGAGSSFVGTLIASRDITLASGATVNGRLISLNSSITATGAAHTISGPGTCVAAPTTETINVTKVVTGGTKAVADFHLFVNGSPVTSGAVNSFNAPATYTVTETPSLNYTATFSGSCPGGVINLTLGNPVLCTITNTYTAPAPIPSPSGGGGGGPLISTPVPPLISVLKIPTPLSLPQGPGLVTYDYTVLNVGTVAMNNVKVTDDKCSNVSFIGGDTNGDSKLDINEIWKYHCVTTLTQTTTNTVTATGVANGITAVDTAEATVVVGVPLVPPLIHVVKVPNVFVLPAGGGAVTYMYTVTNPGTVPLSNVSITDDKCTGLPGRVTGHPGDLNKNNLLESNESWSFTCQTYLTQTTTNIGTADGSANGMTAVDHSLATVVVAVPGLPKTGFPPEEKNESFKNFLKTFGISY